MLLIYLKDQTSRSNYVFDWIFESLGIRYQTTPSPSLFSEFRGPKIWYAGSPPEDDGCCYIGETGLLSDDTLKEWNPQVFLISEVPVFFKAAGDMGFDIFSAVFYLLSRYEEYLPFEPDKHGRFPASQSLAFRNHFIDIPVIDYWLRTFREKISQKFPELVFRDNRFKTIMTYDVDVAFKYLGRSQRQTMLAMGKDFLRFQWMNIAKRLMVISRLKKDPWNTFDDIRQRLGEFKIEAIIFFLCGTRTQFDRNTDIRRPATRALLEAVRTFAKLGIHPSYFSSHHEERILQEKNTLEREMHREVIDSRQHFLKFRCPSTFIALENAGIQRDYSMGYPETPGFRAGTSRPFYFYNLKTELPSRLKIFPVCWMDTTFTHYNDNHFSDALPKAKELIKKIRSVGGIFIPIFHNDSLEKKSWRSIHKSILTLAAHHPHD